MCLPPSSGSAACWSPHGCVGRAVAAPRGGREVEVALCDRQCSSTLRTASRPLACSVCLPSAANTAVLSFENCTVLAFDLCCIFSRTLVALANTARVVLPVLCPLQVFSLLRKLGSSQEESTALYPLLPGTFLC